MSAQFLVCYSCIAFVLHAAKVVFPFKQFPRALPRVCLRYFSELCSSDGTLLHNFVYQYSFVPHLHVMGKTTHCIKEIGIIFGPNMRATNVMSRRPVFNFMIRVYAK